MALAGKKGGAGCALAVLAVLLGVAALVSYKFGLLWWNKKNAPTPSGKEMRVQVLDVGQGDSILIISPEGKTVLIDAGDEKHGQAVFKVLKDNNVQQIDYFILTHYHPDHIGGAAAVLYNFKVGTVLENGFPPPEALPTNEPAPTAGKSGNKKQPKSPPKVLPKQGRGSELPTIKAYNNFKSAVDQASASEVKTKFEKPQPEQKIDLGGGAILTVLAPPTPPLFKREQFTTSRKGNESNANSIVVRLDYGDFSMLLPGDAEAMTEESLIGKDANLAATILKVSHHGSKYATSENFLKRVQPKVAIISMSEFNRYGHPNQDVLNRLKAAEVKELYRTDWQGQITITTTGKLKDNKLYEIKAAKEFKGDLWVGREATKDDSSPNFITYGDFEPPKKQKK